LQQVSFGGEGTWPDIVPTLMMQNTYRGPPKADKAANTKFSRSRRPDYVLKSVYDAAESGKVLGASNMQHAVYTKS